MAALRAPWVVTASMTALVACDSPPTTPAADKSGVNTAPAPTATPAATTTATASPPSPAPEPASPAQLDFEKRDSVLNPRIAGKVVVLSGERCFSYGPRDERISGIVHEHIEQTCPEGIKTTLALCQRGILERKGDGCECWELEGNPPMPPKTVACPE